MLWKAVSERLVQAVIADRRDPVRDDGKAHFAEEEECDNGWPYALTFVTREPKGIPTRRRAHDAIIEDLCGRRWAKCRIPVAGSTTLHQAVVVTFAAAQERRCDGHQTPGACYR